MARSKNDDFNFGIFLFIIIVIVVSGVGISVSSTDYIHVYKASFERDEYHHSAGLSYIDFGVDEVVIRDKDYNVTIKYDESVVEMLGDPSQDGVYMIENNEVGYIISVPIRVINQSNLGSYHDGYALLCVEILFYQENDFEEYVTCQKYYPEADFRYHEGLLEDICRTNIQIGLETTTELIVMEVE